jgi:hypothetical protein
LIYSGKALVKSDRIEELNTDTALPSFIFLVMVAAAARMISGTDTTYSSR